MTTYSAAPMPELGLELVRDVDRERIRSRLPRWDPRLWGDAPFSKNTRPGDRLLKLGLAWGRERVKARKLQQENVTPRSDDVPVSRFTGKEEDVEVGLQYFGKRYLSPYLGRWISADPLAVHAPGKADLNLYAYVRGGVLKGIDPVGLDGPVMPWDVFLQKAEETIAQIAVNTAKEAPVKAVELSARSTPIGITYTFFEGLHEVDNVQPYLDRCMAGQCGAQDVRPLENMRDDLAVHTGEAVAAGTLLHVTAPPNAYQASPLRVRANAEAFREKVLNATGEDIAAPAVPRDLEGEAVAARDALIEQLKGERHPPATVAGASSKSVGRATAGASKGGGLGCAEGTCAENLGNPPDIKFTKAIRPRTGEEIPVCEKCEADWGREAFPPDAKFKSDSTPKDTPKE